jgi:hypothetical protein
LRPFLRFLAGTAAMMGGDDECAGAGGGESVGVVSIDIKALREWTVAGQLPHGNCASFHNGTRMRQQGIGVKPRHLW